MNDLFLLRLNGYCTDASLHNYVKENLNLLLLLPTSNCQTRGKFKFSQSYKCKWMMDSLVSTVEHPCENVYRIIRRHKTSNQNLGSMQFFRDVHGYAVPKGCRLYEGTLRTSVPPTYILLLFKVTNAFCVWTVVRRPSYAFLRYNFKRKDSIATNMLNHPIGCDFRTVNSSS
jgi:hypothetical protein